jgi:hypothetical protein
MSDKNKVTPAMTMGDIEKVQPNTREKLKYFHIGACPSCDYDLKETLETVADKNGAPVSLLVKILNQE